MDLHHYLRAVRRSLWIVALVAIIGAAAGYWHAARSPKVYAASVSFYVATPRLQADTAFGSDQFAQDRANTYARLLSSQRFAESVRTASRLSMSAEEISGEISGSSQVGTVLVDARIQDTSLSRLTTLQRTVATQFPLLVSAIESSAAVKLEVVSTPPVSAAPVAPRKSIDVIVGFAVGLALGLLIAALRQLLDTSIRSGFDLEEIAGVPLLGSIVADPTASRAPVAIGEAAPSRRAEQFRQLRTNLEFVHTAERAQAIAVTSSIAGEGKSSTALNLAVAAAERGGRVLLVDADLRRPELGRLLGFDSTVGLTTVLTGNVKLSTAVQSWGEHGLAVLASGQTPPNPSELLNSDAMRELLREMREKYELIIFDTPPVLAVTDAAVCATLVDGVFVLYRYGKTRRAHLDACLHSLRAVDARILGVGLNMLPRRGADGEGDTVYGSYYAVQPDTGGGTPFAQGLARLRQGRRRATGLMAQLSKNGAKPDAASNAVPARPRGSAATKSTRADGSAARKRSTRSVAEQRAAANQEARRGRQQKPQNARGRGR
ncbi:polysaccharide biosynthesis tyrosine autokinase [uncultured Jatrophihabitans sp.]|uniref:polysaccharide biosynthesis tyrosine autokinase n=1 Tax=uncultured Jatrophihabitans sp. TaxID=1610747 RepID=UPI0035CA63CD